MKGNMPILCIPPNCSHLGNITEIKGLFENDSAVIGFKAKVSVHNLRPITLLRKLAGIFNTI